jgi:hypothetical protein
MMAHQRRNIASYFQLLWAPLRVISTPLALTTNQRRHKHQTVYLQKC